MATIAGTAISWVIRLSTCHYEILQKMGTYPSRRMNLFPPIVVLLINGDSTDTEKGINVDQLGISLDERWDALCRRTESADLLSVLAVTRRNLYISKETSSPIDPSLSLSAATRWINAIDAMVNELEQLNVPTELA